MGHN